MVESPRASSAYASDEHLARLLVRCFTGQWAYSLTSERWLRRIDEQWVVTLPHEMRERCQDVIDAVIRDAERIPDELRNDPRLVDRVLILAAGDLRK